MLTSWLRLADDRYHIDQLRGLHIKAVTLDDNGQYQCRAYVSSNGNFKKVDINVDVDSESACVCERVTSQCAVIVNM